MADHRRAKRRKPRLLINDIAAQQIDGGRRRGAQKKNQQRPIAEQFVDGKRKYIEPKIHPEQRVSPSKGNGIKPLEQGVPVAHLGKTDEQADEQSDRGNDQPPWQLVQGKFNDLRHPLGTATDDSEAWLSPPSCGSRSRGDETIKQQDCGGKSGRDDKYAERREPSGREDSAESQRAKPQQVDEEAAEHEEPHQDRNDRRCKYERAFFHQ